MGLGEVVPLNGGVGLNGYWSSQVSSVRWSDISDTPNGTFSLSLAKTVLRGEKLHPTRGETVVTEYHGSRPEIKKHFWWNAAVAPSVQVWACRILSRTGLSFGLLQAAIKSAFTQLRYCDSRAMRDSEAIVEATHLKSEQKSCPSNELPIHRKENICYESFNNLRERIVVQANI